MLRGFQTAIFVGSMVFRLQNWPFAGFYDSQISSFLSSLSGRISSIAGVELRDKHAFQEDYSTIIQGVWIVSTERIGSRT